MSEKKRKSLWKRLYRFFFPEDEGDEGRRTRFRTGVLVGVFCTLLGSFLVILYDVQHIHGDEYRERANYSAAATETVESVRGDILDSYGRVLVTNAAQYEVTLDTGVMGEGKLDILSRLIALCREERVQWDQSNFHISDTAPWRFTKGEELFTYEDTDEDGNTVLKLTRLGRLSVNRGWIDDPTAEGADGTETNIQARELMAAMCGSFGIDLGTGEGVLPKIDRDTRDLLSVLYELALRESSIVSTQYVFAGGMDISFITKAKERELHGVDIEAAATRHYNTTYAAHILGRTGKIDPDSWESYKEQGYAYDAVVGISGAESAFEEYLRGLSGKREIITSDTGKLIQQTWLEEPEPGGNVALTLDITFQTAVEQALERYMGTLEVGEDAGAAVAVVDMSGGVKALASYPTYNLATYSQDFSQLLEHPGDPLVNKATQGLYAPGSTFKMVTALAGLMEGEITTRSTITCRGSQVFYANDNPRYCHTRSGHGSEDVTEAITHSCNIFFYNMGFQLGIDTLGDYAARFGLGQRTGIEIGDNAGFIAGPDTSKHFEQTWYGGNVLSAAIGQDNNLFTPLQLANYVATMVNGGDLHQVHLLQSVKSSDYSEVLYQYQPQVVSSVDIPEDYLEAVKEGMYGVTQSYALAARFNRLPVKVGAKTGTAQINNNTGTNALFVAFAPYDDPEIALCIVVEEGASGSSLGGLAAEILSYYFQASESLDAVTGENILIR